MADDIIITSEIPWHKLKRKELEELLYWLFDAMGAKELEWRVGGVGGGAFDKGRDLELSFYVSSPEGELVKQRWWVEAKGRKGTVEPMEAKSAVINAAGSSSIDVLVIATNTCFSNPTRDWVREWQDNNPRPIVKLWERANLEMYCSNNTVVAIRLFGKALTPQGRLEVCKVKLWDYLSFSDKLELDMLWNNRSKLKLNEKSLLSLVACEMANGDISIRSWGMFASKELVASTLCHGLLNCLYLCSRADERGTRQAPIVRSLAYLVLICIKCLGGKFTSSLLCDWGRLNSTWMWMRPNGSQP